MNFDFLKDNAASSHHSREPDTYEDRDPGVVDGNGRRITYSVRRMVHRNPPYPTTHLRWVYVLRDNETVREIDGNWHATYEEAEQWVEKQIGNSIASYQRRGGSSRSRRVPQKQGGGCRFVAVVMAVVAAAIVAAAVWLSATMPH